MAMKYIIVSGPGGEMPVVFPRAYYHSDVAQRFTPAKVVAAGFVRLTDGAAECYGGSSSLRIVSRRHRDSELVAHHLSGGS
jgi:hypothetical protein